MENYVVALYDFRSKQRYIYNTNYLKEITGGSELLKDVFKDFLDDASNGLACKVLPYVEKESFDLDQFRHGEYCAAVLYEGGGNVQMIFKDEAGFKRFNNAYSLWILKNRAGLSPICAVVPFADNYSSCFEKLREKMNQQKNTGSSHIFANVLPITQIDRKNGLPIVKKVSKHGDYLSLSKQSVVKRQKYETGYLGEDNLDKMVTKKGENSLLAVVYIDGNGIGEKLARAVDTGTFADGVNKMRRFSEEIKRIYVDEPFRAIKETAMAKNQSIRQIIGGGDEITFIANASIALELVEKYFEVLNEKGEGKYSASAGIAIFHSHDPYTIVYEYAEQCCESGKKRIKKLQAGQDNYLDFYLCNNSKLGSLQKIRETQDKDRTNNPYCIKGNDAEHSFALFKEIGDELKELSRSNVKALRDAAFRGRDVFEINTKRILANISSQKITNNSKIFDYQNIRTIIDATAVFDIWFHKRGGEFN